MRHGAGAEGLAFQEARTVIHVIASALIHGLIYRLIWSFTRGMGEGRIAAIAFSVIGGLVVTHLLFRRRRNRNRRRW